MKAQIYTTRDISYSFESHSSNARAIMREFSNITRRVNCIRIHTITYTYRERQDPKDPWRVLEATELNPRTEAILTWHPRAY